MLERNTYSNDIIVCTDVLASCTSCKFFTCMRLVNAFFSKRLLLHPLTTAIFSGNLTSALLPQQSSIRACKHSHAAWTLPQIYTSSQAATCMICHGFLPLRLSLASAIPNINCCTKLCCDSFVRRSTKIRSYGFASHSLCKAKQSNTADKPSSI